MITKKEIDSEFKEITSLRNLAEIYGEIASIRMMKIRNYVLTNRDFIASITDIFSDALASYSRDLSQKLKSRNLKNAGKITFLAHNGKTVTVLISANTGFYGDVIQETFRKFLEDIKGNDTEVTIVGRLGKQLFSGAMPDHPFTYYDLPDFGIDKNRLVEVIKHLVQYEEVHIYYGKYVTVLNQIPAVSIITAGTTYSDNEAKKENRNYLFEPSVEKILMFFEKEIFASFFDQSLRESQLAKYASRIFAMDRASQNIKERLHELKFEGLRYKHRTNEKKQLNSLSSVLFRS